MSKKRCPSCGVCACTTCCYQITVSGLTFETTNDAGIYTLDVTSEGTLNATFIICGSSSIPVAFRTEITNDDGTVTLGCKYADISTLVYGSPDAYFLQVTIQGPAKYVLTEDVIFRTNISITDEQAAITSSGVCTEFGTVTGSNVLDPEDGEYPFNNGSGSVSVTMVPTCNGANPVFTVDCSTSEGFAQTICDEDDCPCGRTSEQPTCALVTIKGSDGTDSVYQNGTLVTGTATRDYIFAGPYRRNDGTWWRFIVVTDDPDSPAWNSDGAYFEHQCPGDNLDSVSGTYTYADAGDWTGTGAAVGTVLTDHQTALTGIGTTVTVAACTCEEAADDYLLELPCDTTPASWPSDITLSRTTTCEWVGTDGTYTATLTFTAGTWTLEVRRTSDDVLFISAVPWTAAGSDPTGTHGYDYSIGDEDGCITLVIS